MVWQPMEVSQEYWLELQRLLEFCRFYCSNWHRGQSTSFCTMRTYFCTNGGSRNCGDLSLSLQPCKLYPCCSRRFLKATLRRSGNLQQEVLDSYSITVGPPAKFRMPSIVVFDILVIMFYCGWDFFLLFTSNIIFESTHWGGGGLFK